MTIGSFLFSCVTLELHEKNERVIIYKPNKMNLLLFNSSHLSIVELKRLLYIFFVLV